MAQILTAPTKQSPFPYAATGIAAYTGKAEIVFDDSASTLALAVDGATINDEDVIVQSLAKQTGLAEDSTKVGTHVTPCQRTFAEYLVDSGLFRLGQNLADACCLLRHRLFVGLSRRSSCFPHIPCRS